LGLCVFVGCLFWVAFLSWCGFWGFSSWVWGFGWEIGGVVFFGCGLGGCFVGCGVVRGVFVFVGCG